MIDATNNIGEHEEVSLDLQASEIRYRRLFESAQAGILILDAVTQKITDANPFMVELLGYTRDEVVGKELWEIGLFKDKGENQATFRELQKTGYIHYEDLPVETKGGKRCEIELVGNAYTEGMRQVIQCNIRDITERKRAEAALREQAALHANAQRAGGIGNWNLDLRSGRLVWSEETCKLFGITPAEFAGTFEHFYSFILDEDLPACDAAHARVSPSDSLLEVEYRIHRPDGAVRWMYERGTVEFDATGTPIGRVGIVMDITERHAAREQLAQKAALLAQIAGKAARLGGWTIDLPERTLTWSDENCDIHDVPPGYKPTLEEGIGYFPAEYRAEVVGYVEACAREGTPYDFEFPKFTAKGRRIWVRSVGEAVRDAEGRIIRLQGAFQDITVRKQAEAEKEKLIKELQDALAEVKTLREILPICSYCKKVRDDENYWSQIESYISRHTGTQFTHGICPECYEIKIAPEIEEIKRRNVDRRYPRVSTTRLNES
jgi:PAS domain S-box-containing protein